MSSIAEFALATHDFERAAGLLRALYTIRNMQHVPLEGQSPGEFESRRQILQLCEKIIEADVHRHLDDFATRWVTHRGLKP